MIIRKAIHNPYSENFLVRDSGSRLNDTSAMSQLLDGRIKLFCEKSPQQI